MVAVVVVEDRVVGWCTRIADFRSSSYKYGCGYGKDEELAILALIEEQRAGALVFPASYAEVKAGQKLFQVVNIT